MNIITANPLLAFPELPPLDAVRAEDVKSAIGTLVADARATIERVAADVAAPTWQNLVEPLADALDRLDRAWSIVNYLNAVVSTPAMRDAYHDNLPEVTALFTDLGQDERIYRRYKALRAAQAFGALAAAEQRVIDNELRDFRLGGAELDDAGKARFKEIQQALAELSAKFDDNVLDATNAWSLVVDDVGELAGVPADVVAAARREAEADGRAGWKLTLRSPCYFPVMQYADNRALRAALHRAYVTRASELGASPQWDNTGIIARTLALRTEEARLLGFGSFAELSLVPKMAESPADVLAFLRDLAARAKPFGDRDYRELSAFAADELGLPALEPWDIAWASEKLKLSRFAFSDEDVKQYFPAPKVIAGLFRVVETLYDVRIREASAPAWHDTVRFFEIRDRAGAIVGHFFMDLYARASKQGGAWMDDPVNRRRLAGGVQDPVAFLTCNFSAPADGRPALFTHDEVITLFHEFGHGLHLLLTRVDTPGASGLQGVEWDAVELPSQFMENYCWEWDVVRDMSAHVDSGQPLPRALFDKMLAARNFESGLAMLRQVEFGLVDMLLHSAYDPAGGAGRFGTPAEVESAVRADVRVMPVADYDRSLDSFGHIFAGGYAAGYYSYKWAEVLSADAFSLFEETGILSPATGSRFRDEVLARGGSRPALESFVAFRGRPPQIDALLRHNAMTLSS
ncbi:MAG TPA: M3 family metallopeptidase [Casimicrobiaceae bacterium]